MTEEQIATASQLVPLGAMAEPKEIADVAGFFPVRMTPVTLRGKPRKSTVALISVRQSEDTDHSRAAGAGVGND